MDTIRFFSNKMFSSLIYLHFIFEMTIISAPGSRLLPFLTPVFFKFLLISLKSPVMPSSQNCFVKITLSNFFVPGMSLVWIFLSFFLKKEEKNYINKTHHSRKKNVYFFAQLMYVVSVGSNELQYLFFI